MPTLLMSVPAGVWYLATVTETAEPSESSTTVWIRPLPKVDSPAIEALLLSCKAPAKTYRRTGFCVVSLGRKMLAQKQVIIGLDLQTLGILMHQTYAASVQAAAQTHDGTCNNSIKELTSEALAVPLLTSSATGAVLSIAVPVASYESLMPWLSAMRTMSPLSSNMRATSTPEGKRPPPLLLTSTTYLHVRGTIKLGCLDLGQLEAGISVSCLGPWVIQWIHELRASCQGAGTKIPGTQSTTLKGVESGQFAWPNALSNAMGFSHAQAISNAAEQE